MKNCQLPGLEEVIHVRVLCEHEAPYQGKVSDLTANAVPNTGANGDAQIVRLFSVRPGLELMRGAAFPRAYSQCIVYLKY